MVLESLAAMGIPPDSLAIYDGSGLSRLNLITPGEVVLLDYMAHHPYFAYFSQSLPVAGVDGTPTSGCKSSGLRRAGVRAKTGTLSHTVSLSGYLPDCKGRLLAFSIMSNNFLGPSAEVRLLQDTMAERLVHLGEEK